MRSLFLLTNRVDSMLGGGILKGLETNLGLYIPVYLFIFLSVLIVAVLSK